MDSMIFENLIINNKIWERLYSSFSNNKIPNAYIFFGTDGIGKEAHAIELAALLNCKRKTEEKLACGDCRSCLRIKSFQHEDVHYIYPLPTLKNKGASKKLNLDSSTIQDLNKCYNEKLKNPYYKIQLKNANIIPINAIRSIKKKLFYTKSDGNWSVVIISDAEKLCLKKAEAANSLLKILEEPPEKTLFILLTSKVNLLTSTILSRCQKKFFPDLNNSELEGFMTREFPHESFNEADFQLSHGSITSMINTIKLNRLDYFEKIIDYFYSNQIGDIENFSNIITKIHTENKNEIPIYLNHLKVTAKDLYGLSVNESNGFIEYSFLHDRYKDILNRFPDASWINILNFLNDSIRDLSSNVYFLLNSYSLMINIQYCLKGNKLNTKKSDLIIGI